MYAKARNEPSEAVLAADDVKYLIHQRSFTHVDIDGLCSRGVKSQIFFKLLT